MQYTVYSARVPRGKNSINTENLVKPWNINFALYIIDVLTFRRAYELLFKIQRSEMISYLFWHHRFKGIKLHTEAPIQSNENWVKFSSFQVYFLVNVHE